MFIKERKSLSKLRPVLKKWIRRYGYGSGSYLYNALSSKLYYRELVKVGWRQSEEKLKGGLNILSSESFNICYDYLTSI